MIHRVVAFALALLPVSAFGQLVESFEPARANCCLPALARSLAEQLQDWNQLGRYHADNERLKAAKPDPNRVVFLGDSITDGTASTLNGDDRWPDVFARRLHAVAGNRYSVVNEGIGGNEVVGPPDYAAKPTPGGPSALDRLQRDVISLPGVSTVIWLEGINDFGARGASAQAVSDGVREGVKRLRAAIPGVRIYMATLTGALNSTPTHGTPEVEAKRKEYNQFIRSAGIFDGVIDFDVVTLDPATGELKAVYQPNSTVGGAGDKLHPNRAGYAAMGNAIDIPMIVGK